VAAGCSTNGAARKPASAAAIRLPFSIPRRPTEFPPNDVFLLPSEGLDKPVVASSASSLKTSDAPSEKADISGTPEPSDPSTPAGEPPLISGTSDDTFAISPVVTGFETRDSCITPSAIIRSIAATAYLNASLNRNSRGASGDAAGLIPKSRAFSTSALMSISFEESALPSPIARSSSASSSQCLSLSSVSSCIFLILQHHLELSEFTIRQIRIGSASITGFGRWITGSRSKIKPGQKNNPDYPRDWIAKNEGLKRLRPGTRRIPSLRDPTRTSGNSRRPR